jgi:hypothetical protein
MGQKKGAIPWNKGKKTGQIPWNKGIKSWVKPWLGKKRSLETIEKVRASKIGISVSPQTEFRVGNPPPPHKLDCKCFRCGGRGYSIPKGTVAWNKGLPAPWTKGENHYKWRGGIPRAWFGKRRRARERNATGSHTFQEWEALKNKYDYMCLCCKRFEPEIKLTEDHIIPISLGGSDNISNIQPLCRSCNSRKQTNTISYLPEVGNPTVAVA